MLPPMVLRFACRMHRKRNLRKPRRLHRLAHCERSTCSFSHSIGSQIAIRIVGECRATERRDLICIVSRR